jgi:hypothetical protein
VDDEERVARGCVVLLVLCTTHTVHTHVNHPQTLPIGARRDKTNRVRRPGFEMLRVCDSCHEKAVPDDAWRTPTATKTMILHNFLAMLGTHTTRNPSATNRTAALITHTP